MSVINKMLQDLDRREAGPGSAGPAQPHVQPVVRGAHGREWFWRTLAVLIFFALGWVSWVSYQMWPRPIVTELAYKSAEEARARAQLAHPAAASPAAPVIAAVPPQATAPVAPPAASSAAEAAPVPPPAPVAPAAEAPTAKAAATPPETLRLAQSIETPIGEPVARPAAKPLAKPSPPKALAAPAPAVPSTAAKEQPKVERRDRIGTPAERAENEFRYAAAVLKLGRTTEAETHFSRALELDAGHRGARQALAALRIERGELDAARQLLEEGLRLDGGQPEFAIGLARILIERRDLPGALAALDGSAAAAAEVPEFHILRATVLQRLGRHAQAAEAYRVALRQQAAMPQAWVGLGISLEALHQRRDAANAFRQALVAGPVNAEVKAFAEQRIRALR